MGFGNFAKRLGNSAMEVAADHSAASHLKKLATGINPISKLGMDSLPPGMKSMAKNKLLSMGYDPQNLKQKALMLAQQKGVNVNLPSPDE
jgi:hypothetical protein